MIIYYYYVGNIFEKVRIRLHVVDHPLDAITFVRILFLFLLLHYKIYYALDLFNIYWSALFSVSSHAIIHCERPYSHCITLVLPEFDCVFLLLLLCVVRFCYCCCYYCLARTNLCNLSIVVALPKTTKSSISTQTNRKKESDYSFLLPLISPIVYFGNCGSPWILRIFLSITLVPSLCLPHSAWLFPYYYHFSLYYSES